MTIQTPWRIHDSAVVDPIGRVLSTSDNRIGRAIHPAFSDEFAELVRLASKRKWYDHGLVDTWLSNDTLDGYGVVLEHARVPFVTFRREWPALALQKAALCTLDLAIVLSRDGYGLKDAHCWNVLFQGTRPKFIDFTSIRPLHEINGAAWMREFRNYFLAPILAFASGQSELARALTIEHLNGVGLLMLNKEISPLLTLPEFQDYSLENLEALRTIVGEVSFRNLGGEWNTYEQPSFLTSDLRDKDLQVKEILDRLSYSSVIDIGANRGLHSFLAAERGAQVVSCDIEEGCLNDIFRTAEARDADVLPTYLDIVDHAGASGAFNTNQPANERLKCDLVIALALIHHVCFRRRFYVDVFINSIARFATKHAIIEFIPDDDVHVAAWQLPPLPGYDLDGVRAALLDHFESVEDVPMSISPRRAFICTGKKT